MPTKCFLKVFPVLYPSQHMWPDKNRRCIGFSTADSNLMLADLWWFLCKIWRRFNHCPVWIVWNSDEFYMILVVFPTGVTAPHQQIYFATQCDIFPLWENERADISAPRPTAALRPSSVWTELNIPQPSLFAQLSLWLTVSSHWVEAVSL